MKATPPAHPRRHRGADPVGRMAAGPSRPLRARADGGIRLLAHDREQGPLGPRRERADHSAGAAPAPSSPRRARNGRSSHIQDFALDAERTGAAYRHRVRAARDRASRGEARAAPLRCRRAPRCSPSRPCTSRTACPPPTRRASSTSRWCRRRGDEPFAALPPGTWLLRQVPWTDAEHVIRAVNADRALARNLAVAAGAACLVLERRTWQAGAFVTEARITYPGDRHHLVGRFSPVAQGG